MLRIVTGPATALGLVVVAYAATALTDVDGVHSIGQAVAGAATVVPRPVAIGAAIALAALTLVEIARDGLLTWLGTRHDHDHGHAHGPAHDHGHGHGHDHDHDAA